MPTGAVVGRQTELAELGLLLTEDAARALVIQGEPGVGKSTLIDQVCTSAAADGWQVVRVLGVQAEEAYTLGGLNQLAFGLVEFTVGLTEQDRAVLAPVFGGEPVAPPEMLSLARAVLNLLAFAARMKPVLVAIDDMHWLDGLSAEVLSAVGRRLTHPGVRILAGRRTPDQSAFAAPGWSEFEVTPLGPADAERLLDRVAASLPAVTRAAVLATASGNPLALNELPRFADRIEWGAGAIPLTERLVRVFGGRLEQLDPGVRAELLRAALDGIANGASQFANRARYVMRDVEQAMEAGLLVVDPLGEIVFRHPLVGAAVIHQAGPQERRDAHRDLAGLYEDVLVRRATHLAAAATGPDQEVAELLMRAAQLSVRQGGLAVAVEWMRRAAELSTDPDRRTAFLAEAVFAAARAGRVDEAAGILDDTELGPRQSALAVLAACYRDLHADGEVIVTHRWLLDALARSDDIDDQTVNWLAYLLLAVTHFAGDDATREQTNAALVPLQNRIHPTVLIYRVGAEDIVATAGVIRSVLSQYLDALPRLPPRMVMLLAFAAYCIDSTSGFSRPVRDAYEQLRGQGASIDALEAGRPVLLDLIATGDWDRAEEVGASCLEMARQAEGSELLRHQYLADVGLLAAWRGDLETARRYATEVTAWSAPRGLLYLQGLADRIAVRLALAEADYEAAYRAAIKIGRPGHFPRHTIQVGDDMLDFVEAAVRSGRIAEARRHIAEAARLNLAEVSPRVAALMLAISALAASDPDAGELYQAAVDHPGIAERPFEHARVILAQGMWLRRKLRHAAARDALLRAVEGFDRLGARPWADRARAELEAAGAPTMHRTADSTMLSPQESRIAALAAAGQSSKEIATQLSISSRTVDAHLSSIFRKLGINRRSRLAAALQDQPWAVPESPPPHASGRAAE